MIASPGADQSVETMALKGNIGKAEKYSVEILPGTSAKRPTFREQIKAFRTKDPVLALSFEHTHAFPHLLLSPGHSLSLSVSGAYLYFSPALSPSLSHVPSAFLFPKL